MDAKSQHPSEPVPPRSVPYRPVAGSPTLVRRRMGVVGLAFTVEMPVCSVVGCARGACGASSRLGRAAAWGAKGGHR